MSLFQRKSEEKRSIEEILTPKSESEKVAEEEVAVEVETVEIKSETAEGFTDNALKCFGWEFSKTEKWLIKCVNVWYCIASFAWFLFGAITFAPVIFIRSKLKPILKDDLKALLVSVSIYAVFVVALIFLLFVGKGEGATEAASSVL